MAEEKEDVMCLLNKAFSDGVIDKTQYDELASRSVVKAETRDRSDIQKGLITSGIFIIVFVVGFLILLKFRDFSYIAKISLLFFLYHHSNHQSQFHSYYLLILMKCRFLQCLYLFYILNL